MLRWTMRCEGHLVGRCDVWQRVRSRHLSLRSYDPSIEKVEQDFVSARGFLSRPQGGGGSGWRAAVGAFDYRHV